MCKDLQQAAYGEVTGCCYGIHRLARWVEKYGFPGWTPNAMALMVEIEEIED
jgi:hypothetical protein